MTNKKNFGTFSVGIHKLFYFLLVLMLFSSTFLSVTVVSDSDGPKLEYDPKSYDFGDVYIDESESVIFDICNGASEPYDNLDFSLSWDCDWIIVSPTQGSLEIFEYQTIDVIVDTTDLDYGVYNCGIRIDSNAGDGVFDLSVNVVSHPPDKPTISSPYNGAKKVDVDPTILAVNVSDVDDDPLSVTFFDASDDSEIGSFDDVQSGETVTIEWDDLEYETKYSWYAVVDDSFNEIRSDVSSFKTTLAHIFSNLSPSNDSWGISWDIDELSLDVENYEGNTFDWDIKTFPDIGTASGKGSSGDNIKCNMHNLNSDKIYSWTVTAVDSKGEKTESVFNFKTIKNMVPNKPVVVSPGIDALDVSIVCTLNWSCVDPDGDKNLVYDVYLGTTKNPSILEKNVNESFINVTYDLELDTRYYWKIKATDSFGASSESSIFSFKTSNVPPPPSIGSINISFPRRFSLFGFKADITNNGVRDASNIFWHVSIKGGIFGRVNVSNSGCIDILNLNETKRISTYEFLNFKSNPFGLGRVNVSVIATDKNGVIVGMNSIDVFLVFKMMVMI